MSTIGKKIKNLREEIGMSQTDLANKINSSKQTLYKYENGIITNIPSDKIELLASALNTSPAYLMGWEDEEESDKSGRTFGELFKNVNLMDAVEKLGKLQPQDQDMVVNLINSLYEKVSTK